MYLSIHLTWYRPVCERLWILRFSRREKLLLQVGQRWGFSLVWVRMCISILYLMMQKLDLNCMLRELKGRFTQKCKFCLSNPEPILRICRIRKLRRAPETPGGPLALKDVLILVLFFSLNHWWQMDYFGDGFYTFLCLDSVNYLAVNGTVTSLPVFIQNILNCVSRTNKAFTGLERRGGKWLMTKFTFWGGVHL